MTLGQGENVIDLQYSDDFINSIRCPHLPTARPQASIVSQQSTVLIFSDCKAKFTKFGLVVKKVKTNSGPSFEHIMVDRSP